MKRGGAMKHYAMIAAALVAGVLLFTECASMRIPYRRLPAKAKAFIETYFPAERCVYAERDRDDGRREYEVKLSDGTEIPIPERRYGEVRREIALRATGGLNA